MPAAKAMCKDIDDCVLDLCCTSVQGPGDLVVGCPTGLSLVIPSGMVISEKLHHGSGSGCAVIPFDIMITCKQMNLYVHI